MEARRPFSTLEEVIRILRVRETEREGSKYDRLRASMSSRSTDLKWRRHAPMLCKPEPLYWPIFLKTPMSIASPVHCRRSRLLPLLKLSSHARSRIGSRTAKNLPIVRVRLRGDHLYRWWMGRSATDTGPHPVMSGEAIG
jgi:hypothetical protein